MLFYINSELNYDVKRLTYSDKPSEVQLKNAGLHH